MNVLLCAEYYRTKDQGTDIDDYFVDGMKVLNLTIPDSFSQNQEECDKYFQALILTFLGAIQDPQPTQPQAMFPKFTALVKSGNPFWFHVTTQDGLNKRPNEFHGNAFSESELLGIPVEEELSILYSSAGIRLDGHPDKFMLNIGAV